MKRLTVALLLILFSSMILFPACYEEKRLAQKQADLLEELQTHANAFNRMIVWGDYDGASAAVVPEKRIEFLEMAQTVAARVKIEDFTVPLCQVGVEPFPRDDEIPGMKSKTEPEDSLPAVLPTPEPEAPRENPEVTPEPEGADVKKEKFKMPKVFYGIALVRYINMTVAPSVTVRTRLIKQHWVWVDDSWYCDVDLQELLEP